MKRLGKKRKVVEDENQETAIQKHAKFSFLSASELMVELKGTDPLGALKFYMKSDDKCDKIKDFILEGGSISQLLSLLNGVNLEKSSKALVVFRAMQLFIVQVFIEFPEKKKQVVEECRQLLSIHLSHLISMLLNPKSTKEQKTSLDLLTVIASCHESLALDILFQLGKIERKLQELASADSSLRGSLIQFLMSFLVNQPVGVVRKFLLHSSLLSSIFPGLRNDSFLEVNLVLNSLKSVVNSSSVSKNQKLAVFNTTSIGHLLKLYSWDPTRGEDYGSIMGKEMWLSVRSNLHDLLLVLLTSTKYGVIFIDRNLVQSKQANALVVNLIANIEQPWGDPLREDFFIKLLSACPGAIKTMYKVVSDFMSSPGTDPHQAVSFMKNLILGLELKLEMIPNNQKLLFITNVFIPEFLFCGMKDSLLSANENTRLVYQRLLLACLSKLKDHLGERNFLSSVSCLLISKLGDCSELILKDVSHWTRVNNLENLILCIDCLLIFSKVCPQLLDSVKCSRTVENELQLCSSTIHSAANHPEQNFTLAHIAYLKIIELKLELLPHDNISLKLGDLLDELYIHADSSPEAVVLCIDIIRKVLFIQRGIFSDPLELEIWMHCLSLNFKQDTVKLISSTLKLTRNDVKSINDKLLICEEAADYSEKELSDACLDDFISALETDDSTSTAVHDQSCSVSPFLIGACLVSSKNRDDFKSCDDFISMVISLLLFHQRRPFVFKSLIESLKINKTGTLMSNLLSRPLVSVSSSSLYSKISAWLLLESDHNPTEEKPLSDFQCKVICRQTLYFLMNNLCSLERAVLLLSSLVLKTSLVLESLLSLPIIVNKFHPLLSPSSEFNSADLVVSLLKFTSLSPSVMKPFQKKLTFDLRISLKNKSCLGRDILPIMEAIPILDSDVKYLIDDIFLRSKLFLKRNSQWLIVLMFLLKKATAVNLIMPQNYLEKLIDIYPLWLEDSAIREPFSASLAGYLSTLPEIELNALRPNLHALFHSLCNNVFWSEELACTVFNVIKEVHFGSLPIDRFAVLFKVALSYDSFHFNSEDNSSKKVLKEMLNKNTEVIKNALTSCPMPEWVSNLTYSLKCLKFSCKSLKKLCSWVMSLPEKPTLCEASLDFYYHLFTNTSKTEELFQLTKKWLINSIADQNIATCNQLSSVCAKLLNEDCKNYFDDEFCKLLILTALKSSCPQFLKLLSMAVKFSENVPPPRHIFALLSSHSMFLDTILSPECELKFQLTSLIYELILKDESIMKSSHVSVYLASYDASLSRCDQMMFLILRKYESICTPLNSWQPYVWGEKAIHRYSVREINKRVDVTSSPTLELLDQVRLEKTVQHFPSTRYLMDEVVNDYIEGSQVYDPAFILAVISFVIGPESDIPTYMVAKSGALSLAVASLNSCDESIRALGYHVLHKFYISLTGRKNDLIWSNFIQVLQRSVVGQRNQRLSGIMSNFLASASFIITNPAHDLYGSISKYFLAKPIIKLDQVPAFLELFHVDEQHQIWIMMVIGDGIRDEADVDIMLRSFTLKLILDYYTCALASPPVKHLIELFIEKTVAKDHKRLLTKEYSLISWLVCNKNYSLALQVTPHSNKYLPLYNFISKKIEFESMGKNNSVLTKK